MLGPDSERSQGGVWWSHLHHFPPQEKETLLRVSPLLFDYLRWSETHLHPTYGPGGQPASATKLKALRRAGPCTGGLLLRPEPPRTATSQPLPRPPCSHSVPRALRTLGNAERGQQAAADSVEAKSKTVLHLPLPRTCGWWEIVGENQKKRLVPVLVALLSVFYRTWDCSTNLFYWIGYSTCVAYSHWYYFRKFTNLPVYPGLTNPYQISLKTKYFVFISTFSLFLPKLLEPTWTSECLTIRRDKKTFLS